MYIYLYRRISMYVRTMSRQQCPQIMSLTRSRTPQRADKLTRLRTTEMKTCAAISSHISPATRLPITIDASSSVFPTTTGALNAPGRHAMYNCDERPWPCIGSRSIHPRCHKHRGRASRPGPSCRNARPRGAYRARLPGAHRATPQPRPGGRRGLEPHSRLPRRGRVEALGRVRART